MSKGEQRIKDGRTSKNWYCYSCPGCFGNPGCITPHQLARLATEGLCRYQSFLSADLIGKTGIADFQRKWSAVVHFYIIL